MRSRYRPVPPPVPPPPVPFSATPAEAVPRYRPVPGGEANGAEPVADVLPFLPFTERRRKRLLNRTELLLAGADCQAKRDAVQALVRRPLDPLRAARARRLAALVGIEGERSAGAPRLRDLAEKFLATRREAARTPDGPAPAIPPAARPA